MAALAALCPSPSSRAQAGKDCSASRTVLAAMLSTEALPPTAAWRLSAQRDSRPGKAHSAGFNLSCLAGTRQNHSTQEAQAWGSDTHGNEATCREPSSVSSIQSRLP